MNFTQRLQWPQDSRWQNAHSRGRRPKPLESIIQEARRGTKGLYGRYQVRGSHSHSHKIIFSFPGREGSCSKQAQTGKGARHHVTGWTPKRGGHCALSVLHKTCQWANGKQGTDRRPGQIHLHNTSSHQLGAKVRRATEHPCSLAEMLGCGVLETAYKERQPGGPRRINWERGRERIFLFYLMR